MSQHDPPSPPPPSSSSSPLSDLLALSPTERANWLGAARAGQGVPAGFNWRGLAFAAAAEARRAATAGAPVEALAAGEIALAASDHVGDESALMTGMGVRATLIRYLGARDSDPLRDPTIVYDWCRAAAPNLTPEEAVRRADQARRALAQLGRTPDQAEAVAAQIRPLRLIKNRLGVLIGLRAAAGAGTTQALPPDLDAWLTVRDRLP